MATNSCLEMVSKSIVGIWRKIQIQNNFATLDPFQEKYFENTKNTKSFFKKHILLHLNLLDIEHVEHFAKDECRQILTVNVENFGNELWKRGLTKWWGQRMGFKYV